jgi:carbon starvation protein
MSVIGVVLLLGALTYGQTVSQTPALAAMFTYSGETWALILIVYGFIAAVLPVWLLLAPRDYLSTFLKIGTIVALAIGIMVVAPVLHMPAVSRYIDGTGPVFSGQLFPFLFITIACGAVSGFHSLVSSGTTPKMIENENQIRMIGYAAMLMESAVAIMAMVAACVLEPGAYFAMNSPAGMIGTTAVQAAATISSWGFVITPDTLTQIAKDIGETTILSRAGGAPTLAVGMAHILSGVTGGRALMPFWYHFAILFEALFILTTIDAGTRVARFMIQDLAGIFVPSMRRTESWVSNVVATAIAVAGWGWFLYQGVIDPLGGINSLWPLFGISNQMLAAIALTLCTVVLFRMKQQRYAWVTIAPTVWLSVCTLVAGWEKLFDPTPAIGFLAQARVFGAALDAGKVLAPARSVVEMNRVVTNDYINAIMTAIFMALVVAMLVCGVISAMRALSNPSVTTKEVGGGLQTV